MGGLDVPGRARKAVGVTSKGVTRERRFAKSRGMTVPASTMEQPRGVAAGRAGPGTIWAWLRVRFRWTGLAILGLSAAGLYGVALAGNPFAPDTGFSARSAEDLARRAKLAAGPMLFLDSDRLHDKFADIDYDLAAVRAGEREVPRLFVTNLPDDLSELTSIAERKRLFIQSMLPIILRINEVIIEERRHIEALSAKASGELSASERVWLAAIAERYEVEPGDLTALMERADILPPSLALAQAAEESGWGTSRFARDGNAVFGERTFTEGAGMVPDRRDDDKKHEVKAFAALPVSIITYMLNLNTHWAYESLRRERAKMRAAGETIDGYRLARTLERYSERGEAYIETIESIIRGNGLAEFDRARLKNGRVTG